MCGIAGVISWSGERSSPGDGAVSRMVSAQRHRGPDGCGIVQCQPGGHGRPDVTLGHTRLAIVDLSDDARQPMSGNDPAVSAVYNGETYNFRSLRNQLEAEGCHFRSHSDTEVVVCAYERWGSAFMHRLRGMFAVAIWDGRRQVLTLVRDRLGIKPLYYYEGDTYLAFASEIRALLSSDLVPRRLDPVSLDQYLAYQTVPAPRTLVDGVRMLPPGHTLTVDRHGRTKIDGYWDLLGSASEEAREAGADESRRRVAGLLLDSAMLHLVSDVPVGVFLSGGIDSSAIVSLLRQGGVTPRTFSVSFTEQAYDEGPHARAVAQHYQTDHDEIRLKSETLCDELPDLVAGFDQPTADGINSAIVSRAVHRAGLKVALSGLGGDEVFGGYPSFERLTRLQARSSMWRHTPGLLRALASTAVERIGGSSASAKMAAILRTDGSVAQAFPILRQLFSHEDRRRLLAPAVTRAAEQCCDPYVDLLEQAFVGHGTRDVGSLVAYAEARTYMHDVLLRDTDQMSMAWSLEVRVPLLDHELVEYVMGLPDAIKFQRTSPKALLSGSLALPLPEGVANRRKQGFVLPLESWMRGPLKAFCAHHLGPDGLGDRGILDRPALNNLWAAFLARDPRVTWSRPWSLVTLNAWLERHRLDMPATI